MAELTAGDVAYVHNVAKRITRLDPEDVAQTALLNAHKATVEKVSRGWLFVIVRNAAARNATGAWYRRWDTSERGDALVPARAETDLEHRRLCEAMEALPPLYREVARRRFLLGYSMNEIATELGVKRAAAVSRAHRAKQALRRRLR